MAVRIPDDEVFDAALVVVGRHGYRGATTRRIAEQAGINEVTLFRRFSDKKTLLAAAIHAEISIFASEGPTPSGDLRADLSRIVTYYKGLYAHRGGLVFSLILDAPHDPDLADLLREPSAVLGRLNELIGHYQRNGQLVDEPPEEAVYSLVGPILMRAMVGRVERRTSQPFSTATAVTRFLHGHQSGSS